MFRSSFLVLFEATGGFIVTVLNGDLIKLFEGDAGLQIPVGLGQGFELVIVGHQVGVGIALSAPPLAVDDLVDDLLGEETGPVKVELGGEDLEGNGIDLLGHVVPAEGTHPVGRHSAGAARQPSSGLSD